MRVSVLGAGSWGTTVAALSAGHNPTVLWARNPEVAAHIRDHHRNPSYVKDCDLPPALHATADLEEAVADADLLVVGVPTSGFRGALEAAAEFVRPWVPVVSLAKGFEEGSLLRMTEVAKEILPGHPAAALTGPNIAREILEGRAAAAVVATEDLDVARAIQGVLNRGLFRLYVNHDVIGCEIGGALKNVVAIATGIGEGLGVGDNTRAAVITRGLAEITRVGMALGAEATTFAGLAGMGDLIVTCMSPHGRNRYVGEQLGKGRKLDDILGEMHMVAEGVKTARLVMDLADQHQLDLPICGEINRVVQGEIGPIDAYRGLTPPGHESEPG